MIGGNTYLCLQTKQRIGTNEIGDPTLEWVTKETIIGYLDLMSQDVERERYKTKVAESSHVFLCDFLDLSVVRRKDVQGVVGSDVYDVVLIDDPQERHDHLEIYLKAKG